MGLNRSTIMALTAELTAAGLVREEPPPTPAGRAVPPWWCGRSPIGCTCWPSTSRWTAWSPPGSRSAASCWSARRRCARAPAPTSTGWWTSWPASAAASTTPRPPARCASASAPRTAG
ncbi:hypothetical protein [Thermocatellispora tengchongensis]|uniref:hypothetical protein n=1 Tax=Thermocatellispora tengchongensis TaxID=1073253 RepID=UPI00363ED5EE